MEKAQIGIIGGSGLYKMEGLTNTKEVEIDTPFGKPSDAIVIGTLEGKRVAFLPRHGRGHLISPTNIPVRANIFALKTLGVEWILSVSAVGSLKEEIKPLDMVIPDQLIDRTRNRVSTFFDQDVAVHISFADPFCPVLSTALHDAAKAEKVRVHLGGTVVVIEGPQFSTRAESKVYRSWGGDIIGMTALPEAKLAREAEICYAVLACSTDYDCWHPSHDSVTVDMVVKNLMKNVTVSQGIVRRLMGLIPPHEKCECAKALENAIITSREKISPRLKEVLGLLIGKYI